MQCPPTFGCELAQQNMHVGASLNRNSKWQSQFSRSGGKSVKVAFRRAPRSRVGESLAFMRFSSWLGAFADGDLGPSGVGSVSVRSGVKS